MHPPVVELAPGRQKYLENYSGLADVVYESSIAAMTECRKISKHQLWTCPTKVDESTNVRTYELSYQTSKLTNIDQEDDFVEKIQLSSKMKRNNRILIATGKISLPKNLRFKVLLLFDAKKR